MTSKARINVSQFVGFPSSPPDKTLTEEFIIAANEVIEMMKMIGSFTKPITADMKKNLNTIESYYNEDKENMKYLEDMPFSEKVVHAYLVWLLRSLDLVSRFLLFAAKDEDLIKEKNNNLRPFLNQAYEETTLPYHGFILQKTFKVLSRLVPTREVLLGSGLELEENIKYINIFIPDIKRRIDGMNKILIDNNWMDYTRV